MKLNRSALVAGVLALGVAACGDDVQVVEPTPPVPPPPPPVEATMAPASASVAVGNSVVFAVNASGGVAGEAASWTCASSNTGIATVTSTSAGCSATGVAAGDVTITASVTKSGETVNVGAQLTVTSDEEPTQPPQPPGDPAFLIVASITDSDDDDDTLSGTVTATINVERGDQTLEMLSLLVDGAVVASQSFGTSMGMAAPEDDAAAEQAVHAFTMSFNSAAYEEHGDHTDVAYMNGEHTISAELQIAGGMMADGMMGHETISSNVQTVTFDNDDGFVVEANLGQASMLDDDGRRWYGGPANGHIMISALAVIYSGEEIGEVTISLADCEAEEADHGNGNGADDHHHGTEASFEFDCEGEAANRDIDVFEGGNDANVLNEDDLPEANIDMEGPATSPYFYPNPNNRELGWVNLTVDFLGEQGPGSKKDGWLEYNDEGADDTGVGGYQPVLRYAKAGSTGGLKDAIAAAPLSLTNLPGESAMRHYCAVVSAVDNLGNESALPDEDDGTCYMAGTPDTDTADDDTNDATGYEMLLEALDIAKTATPVVAATVTAAEEALADAGLLVGVDITPPGIEIDGRKRVNAVDAIGFSIDAYDDEHADHNSGIAVVPVHVSIQRRDTSDTECLDIEDDDSAGGTIGEVNSGEDVACDKPIGLPDADGDVPITFAATPAASNAYYTVSGRSRDKAGNYSAVASHTFVFDATAATATTPAAPGDIDAGEAFQIASFLNDDLSILDYYVTANFAGDIELGVVNPTVVDAFDADPLTHRNHPVTVDVETYAGITTDPGTASTPTTGVTISVRDQAQTGEDPYTEVPTPESFSVDAPGSSDSFTNNFNAVLSGIDAVCVAEKESDCAEANRESATELEVVATADATGAFSEPFERVDFWMQDVNGASWLIGSDTSGESGRVSVTNRARTWTYSLEPSAADLYMLTREAAFPVEADNDSDVHTVRAFGVNDDGVAYALSGTVTIDDGDADN